MYSTFAEYRENGGKIIALAGNPNVGKSTVFNALTGMNQHTGNWTGKTVTNAVGTCIRGEKRYTFVDIPGTYSLMAHSAEEEVARDFICFGNPDGAVIVCDATCLERNLNLALQITEVLPKAVLCVNLMDEAEKKKIRVDTQKLSVELGIPVCAASAREGEGLDGLLEIMPEVLSAKNICIPPIAFPQEIEYAAKKVSATLYGLPQNIPPRWAALRLLEKDKSMSEQLSDFTTNKTAEALSEAYAYLAEQEIDSSRLTDLIAAAYVKRAEEAAAACVTFENAECFDRDRKIDRILTHKIWGMPLMLLLLLGIFWLTVQGANYPSEWLAGALFSLGGKLSEALTYIGSPEWLRSMLIDGIYRTLAWVTSVMLPPMAIFFPLFTLLEDVGYLPRAAFNLDRHFKRAGTCGKQALTMAMGFGCNAAAVTGCRIIDSPRERLIAIITNAFVPCNGRFPTLIAVITMFLAAGGGALKSASAVAILTGTVLLGIALTLAMSRLLSATVLKGVPSSFALELPPYRRPQIGRVIVRSMLDRTIFVLGRAAAVAAPAGLLLWILGAADIGGVPLIHLLADRLDPLGRLMGLDGVILLAFILGFPANEIVLPIMLMAYTSAGSLVEYESLDSLKSILLANGWDLTTAVCMLIFMLCHFPCSTTCITVKKETGSIRWTLLAAALPTITGMLLCMAINAVML